MKHCILFLLPLVLLLFGCQSNDAPEPSGPCLLTEVRSSSGAPFVEWQQLVYDEQNRPVVVRVPGHSDYTFHDSLVISYDANGRYKEMLIDYRGTGRPYTEKAIYSYLSDGRLDKVDIHQIPNDPNHEVYVITFQHTYNSHNQLAEVRASMNQNGQLKDIMAYEYYYNNNKLVSREHYFFDKATPGRWATHYEFDNNKRPPYLGALPHLNDHDRYLYGFLLPHENNITSMKTELHYNGQKSAQSHYVSEYEYNNQGLPVSQKMKILSAGQWIDSYTFTYTYNCR